MLTSATPATTTEESARSSVRAREQHQPQGVPVLESGEHCPHHIRARRPHAADRYIPAIDAVIDHPVAPGIAVAAVEAGIDPAVYAEHPDHD